MMEHEIENGQPPSPSSYDRKILPGAKAPLVSMFLVKYFCV